LTGTVLGDDGDDPCSPGDCGYVGALVFCGEGYHGAACSGAGRASGSVEVGLVLEWGVGVDYKFDVVDVQAACGDVGGNQDGGFTGFEPVEVPDPGRLGQVAVHLCGGHAGGCQLAGEESGAVFGAGEHQFPAWGGSEIGEHRDSVGGRDMQHVVGHLGGGDSLVIDIVLDGVREVPVDEHLDGRVQGGREQQPLTIGRRLVEDTTDSGEKAEVGHVVGLVEHAYLDSSEVACPAAEEVLEPAGAGDDDVDPAAQRGDLRPGWHPTEHAGRSQPENRCQRVDDLEGLACQFAGRGEDQGSGWSPGAAVIGR
jgi:hypothetical protein